MKTITRFVAAVAFVLAAIASVKLIAKPMTQNPVTDNDGHVLLSKCELADLVF